MVMTIAMMAIPAKRGLWSTITLSDGTEVKAELIGDEHSRWMQDAEGNCYVKNAEGFYHRADRNSLLAKSATRKAALRKAIYASTDDGLGTYGKMSMGSVPSIGEYTIPVVMVQFSDTKFKSTTTVAKMMRYYNEEGYHDEDGCVGSVRDYFKSQSNGQFIPTFDVVGIVTLSKASSYYGKDQGEDYIDINLNDLPGDVISAAVEQLGTDFSQYVVPAGDSNHDAGVPLLAMFYAGKGQATESESTTNNNLLWPCEWDANEDDNNGDYKGVHFNSFFIGNELYTGGSDLMGMGIFCHEFGHALGLPDFYVTDYSYSGDDSWGNWSIMDTGGYVNDSYAPIGYNAYEKSYMGWLELKEIGDANEVVLQSQVASYKNSAYIVRYSNTESFIFENRQPGTWYPKNFNNGGVLVSRIAYSKSLWSNNTLNNTQKKKRACVLTANEAKLNYSATAANLYGNNSKTTISTLKTLSGSTKVIGITNITKNSDGTVTLSLNASDPDPDPTPTPTPTPDGALFYESFDLCTGTGGNDGAWNGNIATSTFNPDNSDWTYSAAYGADGCAKFGAGKKSGAITTPAIQVSNESVLTFKAGAWAGDGTNLKLSTSGSSVVLSETNLTMKNSEWTTYSVTITGSGTIQITFTPSKRWFLDEVLVKAVEADGIVSVETASEQSHRIYTIDGRYVGTDLNTLGRGIYIVGGKKIAK